MDTSVSYFNSENYLIRGCDTIHRRKEGIKRLLKGTCKDSILDLGCGDGSVSLQFLSEGSRVVLVDASNFMISKCEANIPAEYANKVSYNTCKIEKYAPKERFDVVLCIGVLAHVKNVTEVVNKVSGYVKEGGYCIFQITDYSTLGGKYIWLYSTLREFIIRRYGYILNRISRNSLIKMANDHSLVFSGEYKYMEKIRMLGNVYSEVLLKFEKV